jgi:hypothetical protein
LFKPHELQEVFDKSWNLDGALITIAFKGANYKDPNTLISHQVKECITLAASLIKHCEST